MVEVIKTGKVNRQMWGVCRCGCEVRCLESDTKQRAAGTCSVASFVTCPECGNRELSVSPDNRIRLPPDGKIGVTPSKPRV